MITILRRIVVLRNEKSGTFGPLSRRRSRIILVRQASTGRKALWIVLVLALPLAGLVSGISPARAKADTGGLQQ